MRSIQFFLFFIICFTLFGCHEQNSFNSNRINRIDISDAYDKKQFVSLSKIVNNKIEYISLETTKDELIGMFPRVYANDSFISVISFRKMFLFYRKTGKIIREIGHFGKDPDGFAATLFAFPFNEEDNTFYARDWPLHQYLCYNWTGMLIRKINAPTGSNTFAPFDNNTYVAYIKNYSGDEVRKLVFFNDRDSTINMFPNYNKYNAGTGFSMYRNHGWFYSFNKKLYFYEQFTDTIFQVDKEKLIPRYKLELGKYLLPYESQQRKNFLSNEMKNFFFVENIFESDRYLFFTIGFQNSSFQGVYDKKIKNTGVTKNEDGFENDVNGFLPFHYFSVNSKGELVGFLEAYRVKQWFAENSEKAAKLPFQLNKFINLKETDNLVVMIAKLKE